VDKIPQATIIVLIGFILAYVVLFIFWGGSAAFNIECTTNHFAVPLIYKVTASCGIEMIKYPHGMWGYFIDALYPFILLASAIYIGAKLKRASLFKLVLITVALFILTIIVTSFISFAIDYPRLF
jgi:hypothetical protein